MVVRFIDNQWQYANNDVWVDFTPTTGDRLIAAVNFDSSQVQMLQGSTGSVNGINQRDISRGIRQLPPTSGGIPITQENLGYREPTYF
ncbi:MAG: hypothetical protein R3C12_03730 [Planctomycetaceae bacterium]